MVGAHAHEWTAVAPTELEVVRELARCLRLIRDGRVPEPASRPDAARRPAVGYPSTAPRAADGGMSSAWA